ncbi:SH3 domain-containing protein [Dyella terrae]|uniref:SH3 domain-containing protein n=1 Tax=Dyella terrae TaxID=522259 RepID=UPI001EFECFE3|nr:SH3 domain-containing protein [Dyella terrae]ULU27569.1 SH3 domain-containing protein [Dyella terrae]
MKRIVWTVLVLFGLASPAAFAQTNGVVTAYVDLYAGPDISYPTIAQLPAGAGVAIQGCTAGWGWCDVITMGMRGWVAGTYVQYTYQNQPVYVADYGARIGIPIVTFSIAAYWGSYYVNRPFYRNRDYWYGRPYAPRPPPRPPGWRPGYRPPGPGYRPPSGGGHRPPPSGNRPPPSQGHRPPSNNRPSPNPGARPPGQNPRPPGGNRPPPNQGGNRPPRGNRPPPNQGGNRPSPGQGNQRPAPRPQPRPAPGNQGGNQGA